MSLLHPERAKRVEGLSASALCRSCGLCCDGTLFTLVRLDAAEAARARASGLPILRRDDGSDALPQRCPALAGRDCTIYESRPAPCDHYACNLLVALRDGEVSADEARAVVSEAHTRIAAGSGVADHMQRHFLGRSGIRSR